MSASDEQWSAEPVVAGGTRGRVVVGVDGSPGSMKALGQAAEIANWRHWTLHLVHAWNLNYPIAPYVMNFSEMEDASREVAEEVVRDAEKSIVGHGYHLDIRRTVEEGPAARVLVKASEGADLLVVGSRGLGGFSSLALGSVGQACVHHAHCPVLIVRPHSRGDES